MTDYQTEYPATYQAAMRLIREARTRAPNFIFVNLIASQLLDEIEDKNEKERTLFACKEYLQKEREREQKKNR